MCRNFPHVWLGRTYVYLRLDYIKKLSKTQTEDAYWTCGGRLRLAKDYVEDKTVALKWCIDIVAENSLNASEIAVKAKDSRTATDSKTVFGLSLERRMIERFKSLILSFYFER